MPRAGPGLDPGPGNAPDTARFRGLTSIDRRHDFGPGHRHRRLIDGRSQFGGTADCHDGLVLGCSQLQVGRGGGIGDPVGKEAEAGLHRTDGRGQANHVGLFAGGRDLHRDLEYRIALANLEVAGEQDIGGDGDRQVDRAAGVDETGQTGARPSSLWGFLRQALFRRTDCSGRQRQEPTNKRRHGDEQQHQATHKPQTLNSPARFHEVEARAMAVMPARAVGDGPHPQKYVAGTLASAGDGRIDSRRRTLPIP